MLGCSLRREEFSGMEAISSMTIRARVAIARRARPMSESGDTGAFSNAYISETDYKEFDTE